MKTSSNWASRPRNCVWIAPLAAGVALLWGAPVSAQECNGDADCDFGFVCDFGEPTGTTGGGGSASGFCGDGSCQGGEEDSESCPDDCADGGTCQPAACESNDDCAQGYECGAAEGSGSDTSIGTSSSGGPVIVCGDGECNYDETSDNCAQDCGPNRHCEPANSLCNHDSECATGYYCDTSQGGGVTGAASSDGGYVSEWYDGYCTAEGTGGGEGGAAGEAGTTTLSDSETSGLTASSSGGAAADGSSNGGGSGGSGSAASDATSNSSTSGGEASGGDGGCKNCGSDDEMGGSRGGCAMAPLTNDVPGSLWATFAVGSLWVAQRRRRRR